MSCNPQFLIARWVGQANESPRSALVITGVDSMQILDQACEAARTFRPLSDSELTALLSTTAVAAARGEFEPFKTSSIFDGTAENPAWLGDEPRRLQDL